MRIPRIVIAAALVMCFALPAAAQYVGVLQSAQTMDRGTIKLVLAPIVVFSKAGGSDEIGLAFRGGYAFTDRFEAEAKLGFFDNAKYVGADGEFWILKGTQEKSGLDLSLTGGLHWIIGNNDNLDIIGLQVMPLISGYLNEKLELYGALDISFEWMPDAPEEFDGSFTRMHLVPGIEYALSDVIDLEGEIGIGLNSDSFTYAAAGIVFYFR